MKNGHSTACLRVAHWRTGACVLVSALLLAACAGAPPQASQDTTEALDAGAIGIDASEAGPAADQHATPIAGARRKPSAPVAVSSVPDGDEGFAAPAAPALPPPLFTPVQAAAQAAAAADLAAEPDAAESTAAGGPSIRFKKPFSERGLPGEGAEVDRGTASWYGLQFHGRRTANGERYDMYDLTAAHKTLPFNTIVSVHNLQTGRSVRVRINDRGPYVDGRVIDLSKAAAEQLGMAEVGLRPVSLVVEEWPAEITGARDSKRPAGRSSKRKSGSAASVEGP